MRILKYDTLDSTNAEARRLLADAGELSLPVCIVAREQTAGRGTRGRTWSSPRDAGLYLSVIDRPTGAAPATVLYTLAAGVACAEAIEEVAGVAVELRPVNDLWIEGRKLGGILVEAHVQADVVTSIVIGVGINVRAVPRTVDAGAAPPVSLEDLLTPVELNAPRTETMASEIAHRIVGWAAIASRGETERVKRAWAARGVAGAEVPGVA